MSLDARTWQAPADERWADNTARFYGQRIAAVREIAEVSTHRAARHVDPGMPDAAIRQLADDRARIVGEWIEGLTQATDAPGLLVLLNRVVQRLDARPFRFEGEATEAEQLRGFMQRARCVLWWRRQLRRAVVRARETQAAQRAEVCKARRQPYVTDDTVQRRAESNARNAAMLDAVELESAAGEIITLSQAVAASVANKAIRRGELMTRIRGCEEWAEAAGMVGLFTTNTTPSRFHRVTIGGTVNPRADGTDGPMQPNLPGDAQRWLCRTWARTRAALQRRGARFFGFRVAEPHHDGCPHWHMLLWVDPEHLDALRSTMRAYWLADHGDEPGAAEHRFKAVDMEKGGATGYVAKYIAKNVDDVGALEAEGHTDERAGEQADMFGGTARRVEAWASAWGIRQFQAIGQPPVTVWRELRRVTDDSAAGASDRVRAAHAAVNRAGERRACWRAYMDAQGGAMTGRDYRVRIVHDDEQREGRYGPSQALRPIGVEDAMRPGVWVLSERSEWKPRGQWTEGERAPRVPLLWGSRRAQPGAPRTRVINCTQGTIVAGELTDFRALMREFAGLNRGVQPREKPPCRPPAPPEPSRPKPAH